MDIDRFKKLVRLANNNPNENEANLAARKACKMIEEADFKLGPETWNDVKRSEESFWRSNPTGRTHTAGNPWRNDPFWDTIRREAEQYAQEAAAREAERKRQEAERRAKNLRTCRQCGLKFTWVYPNQHTCASCEKKMAEDFEKKYWGPKTSPSKVKCLRCNCTWELTGPPIGPTISCPNCGWKIGL